MKAGLLSQPVFPAHTSTQLLTDVGKRKFIFKTIACCSLFYVFCCQASLTTIMMANSAKKFYFTSLGRNIYTVKTNKNF